MSSGDELGDSLHIKPPQVGSGSRSGKDYRNRRDRDRHGRPHEYSQIHKDRRVEDRSRIQRKRTHDGGESLSKGRHRTDEEKLEKHSSRYYDARSSLHKSSSSGSHEPKPKELKKPDRYSQGVSKSTEEKLLELQEHKLRRRLLEQEEKRMYRELERKAKERKIQDRHREQGKEQTPPRARKVTIIKSVVEEMPTVEDVDSSSELEEGEDRSAPASISEISDEEEETRTKEPPPSPLLRSESRSRSGTGSGSKESSGSKSSESDDDSSSGSSSDDEADDKKKNGNPSDAKPIVNLASNTQSPSKMSPVSPDSITEEKRNNSDEEEPENPMEENVSIKEEVEQGVLLPIYFPALQGCRRVEEFNLLNRIEEGTYGVVYRAKDKRTNEIVALKRLKMEKEKDGFPITSLREINTLLKAQHENIVTVREIVVGSNTDKIFLVMDYVEHDLKALMETLKQKEQTFIMGEVKCLMIQLLRAVAHLHDNWILHRDLKTSNLLLSHKGILKVGDFGLAREYGSPLKPYTPIVVTLWYRAPELLLGIKEYSTPIDVWSVGCIFGEFLKMEPMFPGKSEANQLNLIFQTLGTPTDRIWPGYSQLPLHQKMTFADYPMNKLKTRFLTHLTELGIDLLNKFLTFNPSKRITAEGALKHPFFQEGPLPIDPSVFPTWPAKSEMGQRKGASPKAPSGGRQFKDLRDEDNIETAASGFYLGAGGDSRQVGAGFNLKF